MKMKGCRNMSNQTSSSINRKQLLISIIKDVYLSEIDKLRNNRLKYYYLLAILSLVPFVFEFLCTNINKIIEFNTFNQFLFYLVNFSYLFITIIYFILIITLYSFFIKNINFKEVKVIPVNWELLNYFAKNKLDDILDGMNYQIIELTMELIKINEEESRNLNFIFYLIQNIIFMFIIQIIALKYFNLNLNNIYNTIFIFIIDTLVIIVIVNLIIRNSQRRKNGEKKTG